MEPPRGPVETEFLRPLLLGNGIAPYRLLSPALAVLPLAEEGILTAATAADWGYRHVAAWMRDIEAKWQLHCSERADGTPRMTLTEQIDHMRNLSKRLDVKGTTVVYAGSGTLLNAAIVDEQLLSWNIQLIGPPFMRLRKRGTFQQF